MVLLTVIVVVEAIALILMLPKCRIVTVLKATVLSNVAPAVFIWTLINFGIVEKLYYENSEAIGFGMCFNIFIVLIVIALKSLVLYLIIKDRQLKEGKKSPEFLKSTIISVCAITTIMGALWERVCTIVL